MSALTAKQLGFAFGRKYALRVLDENPSITFSDLFVACGEAAVKHSKLSRAFREWIEYTVVDLMGLFEEGMDEGIKKAYWQLGLRIRVD